MGGRESRRREGERPVWFEEDSFMSVLPRSVAYFSDDLSRTLVKPFLEYYTFSGVHSEKSGMRYDALPRSLKLGVQVEHDDPFNNDVCNAFSVHDDNFNEEVFMMTI